MSQRTGVALVLPPSSPSVASDLQKKRKRKLIKDHHNDQHISFVVRMGFSFTNDGHVGQTIGQWWTINHRQQGRWDNQKTTLALILSQVLVEIRDLVPIERYSRNIVVERHFQSETRASYLTTMRRVIFMRWCTNNHSVVIPFNE